MPLDPELPDLPHAHSPPLMEAVGVDAVGAQASERSAHQKKVHQHCESCGTKLQGPFCHQCGQHDFDINRSFLHTFFEALENFFHFDTKLFRNFFTLLFRPGRLTAEFNAGKRSSQVPPFRLYVFISILFFFFTIAENNEIPVTFSTDSAKPTNVAFTIDGEPASIDEAWDAAIEKNSDHPETQVALESARIETRDQTDEIKQDVSTKLADSQGGESEFERKLNKKGEKLKTPEGQRQMLHSFFGAMPKLVLICMPFFALYTRFLFRKSKQVYLQHLVLALHFHIFVFVWVMVKEGWVFLATFVSEPLADNINLACTLWLVIYPFIMLKYLFANSWLKTTFKTFVLSMTYFMTMGLGFLITALMILWVL